jgi:hypothetical protein
VFIRRFHQIIRSRPERRSAPPDLAVRQQDARGVPGRNGACLSPTTPRARRSAPSRSTSLAWSEAECVPPLAAGWDRRFESGSLQRRVRCEPIFSQGGAERQKKTSWPVRFELTEQTRQAVPALGTSVGSKSDEATSQLPGTFQARQCGFLSRLPRYTLRPHRRRNHA